MQMMKMNETEFKKFYDRSLLEFAKQHAEDTGTAIDEWLIMAKAAIGKHLPDGINTKDHYVYHLKNKMHEPVGYLWFGIRDELNQKKVFIYDILVEESFRGKGYSKIILTWLESETKRLGLNEISLHVLGYNYTARALYDSFGFEITNLFMSKKVNVNN